MDTIRAAIVGPTGLTGRYLVELLARHPAAELTYLASHREVLPDLRDEFPRLRGLLHEDVAQCRPIDAEQIAAAADVVFLGLPHKAAMSYAPQLLDAGVRVIDLSADYRLSDADLYEQVYATPHVDRANLAGAVYGLPELFRAPLAGAMLVANPGCYPTAAALAISPLLSHALVQPAPVQIAAASGTTGAGRGATEATSFITVNEGFGPYGAIGGHRHQPEIAQTLSRIAGEAVSPLFVPHLLPIDAGILETVFLEPKDEDVTEADLFEAYRDAYADEPFVRVREPGDALPNVKHVVGTNFCDVSVRLVTAANGERSVVAFAAEDNMMKGASGQAVQNMNAVFELPETTGLR